MKPTQEALEDFIEIRDHPKMIALVGKARLDDRYTALWQVEEGMESTEVHGLPPAEHLARCRDLASQGFRIAAISGIRPDGDPGPVIASVWQRPTLPERVRQRDADRRGMAALALLRLGDEAPAWDRLRAQPDPSLASAIIHGLSATGVEPRWIVDRLDREPRADVRRALLLALGDYPKDGSIRGLLPGIVRRALDLYRLDPDPGVHSAAEWLARTLGAEKDRLKIAAELASPAPVEKRGWYVNRLGQEFSVVPGPVEFVMGAPANTGDLFAYGESNQHHQRIGRSFAIATKEVTNAEFDQFLRENPGVKHESSLDFSREDDAPVANVHWQNAMRYCRWLGLKEGIADDQQPYLFVGPSPDPNAPMIEPRVGYLSRTGYRLPTEAEWEYAVRAGTITRRPHGWSDSLLSLYERFTDPNQPKIADTQTVGRLRPNPLGLFDTLGNIAEWTSTRGDSILGRSIQDFEAGSDGVFNDAEYPGPVLSTESLITRGAAASDRPALLRSSWRLPGRTSLRTQGNQRYGFRVVRTMP
jgi:formylglycine-generating enzyme required for sulfatase activity